MIWPDKSINIKQNSQSQKLQIHKSINKKKKIHSRNYKSIHKKKNPNMSKSSNINPKKKWKRAGKKRKRIHCRLEPFNDGTEELEEDRWFWVFIFEFGWSCHLKSIFFSLLFGQNGAVLHLPGLYFIFIETVSFWSLFGSKKKKSAIWHGN